MSDIEKKEKKKKKKDKRGNKQPKGGDFFESATDGSGSSKKGKKKGSKSKYETDYNPNLEDSQFSGYPLRGSDLEDSQHYGNVPAKIGPTPKDYIQRL